MVDETLWWICAGDTGDADARGAGRTPASVGGLDGILAGLFSRSGNGLPSTSVTTGRGIASWSWGMWYILEKADVGNARGAVNTGVAGACGGAENVELVPAATAKAWHTNTNSSTFMAHDKERVVRNKLNKLQRVDPISDFP